MDVGCPRESQSTLHLPIQSSVSSAKVWKPLSWNGSKLAISDDTWKLPTVYRLSHFCLSLALVTGAHTIWGNYLVLLMEVCFRSAIPNAERGRLWFFIPLPFSVFFLSQCYQFPIILWWKKHWITLCFQLIVSSETVLHDHCKLVCWVGIDIIIICIVRNYLGVLWKCGTWES